MIHNFTKTAAGKKKLASGMKGKHLCWMKIALLSARRKGKRGLQGFCQTIEADFNQINTFLLCQVCSPYPSHQQHWNTCWESLHTQATFRNGDVTRTQPLKLGFIIINCWKSHLDWLATGLYGLSWKQFVHPLLRVKTPFLHLEPFKSS